MWQLCYYLRSIQLKYYNYCLTVSPLNSRWNSKPQCGDLEGGLWGRWFDYEDGDFMKRITSLEKKKDPWEFPGDLVVRTQCFHCRCLASIPDRETKIPKAKQCSQKDKRGERSCRAPAPHSPCRNIMRSLQPGREPSPDPETWLFYCL